MPKTVKDPKSVKKAAEKKQTEPEREASELDLVVSEPEVQKKPSLKEGDFALVACEGLQSKLDRLRESTRGLELQETEGPFKKFFDGLSNKERWSLWKQFENDRAALDGDRGKKVQEDYSSIRGPGSDSKKKKLLKAYLVGGGFKDVYFSVSATFSKTREQEEETSYVPWKKAVDYYGLSELKARILSGSLLARRCPRDPRFWEVGKEVSTSRDKSRFDFQTTGHAASSKAKTLNDFKQFVDDGRTQSLRNMGMEGLDFEESEGSDKEADTGMDPGLKKLLGIKDAPKEKDPLEALETASAAVSQKASDRHSHSKVKAALSVTNAAMTKLETKISDMSCSLKEKLSMNAMLKDLKKNWLDLQTASQEKVLKNASKKCLRSLELLVRDATTAALPLKKGLLWSLVGDYEYMANTLKLPHWKCIDLCGWCDASRKKPNKDPWKFDKPGWKCKEQNDFADDPIWKESHPIFQIAGVHDLSVQLDVLHLLDLGTSQALAASIIKELLYDDMTDSVDTNLARFWEKVWNEYRRTGATCRVSNLTLGMLVNT
ncbi:slc38a6, partial [Symbiodinium necroappetens]